MTKLPMESRPLRLAPDVAKIVEDRLRPLNGKKLEAAQEAVLKVYHSGNQMAHDQWVAEYTQAIKSAVEDV